MNTPAGQSPAAPLAPFASSGREPWAASKRAYHPLSDTLAIYAGWLLAWYVGIVSLTELAVLRSVDIFPDFFHEIVGSSSLFLAAFACFLFLLCRALHTLTGKRTLAGFLITVIGVAVFVLYYLNIR